MTKQAATPRRDYEEALRSLDLNFDEQKFLDMIRKCFFFSGTP